MPRRPSSNHPLRNLRKLAGVTQKDLAQWVGVSVDTIQSIELNRLKLSRDLATKICRQLGCSLAISQNEQGKDEFAVGRPTWSEEGENTRAAFQDFRRALKHFDGESTRELSIVVARCMDLILHAAGRHSGGTLLAVREDIEVFASKLFVSYGLEPFLEGFLREEYPEGTVSNEVVNRTVKNFPIAPLSSAFPFLTDFEKR